MKAAWAVLLALLLCGAAQAEVPVPPLSARVTDLTATLDAQQKQALESRLAAFEAKKGAQLAVLFIPTTQPETIEQFALRVAEAWKLGRKGVDDGALLLVAKDDRALRIEVGYGLEGALNDATAKRIIAEIITPFFKRGEFYAGIDAGTAAMMRVIDGEPLPRAAASGSYDIESLLFIAFGLVVVVGGMLRALLGRFPAAMLMGGGLGLLAWLTVAPMLVALLVGLMAFVFVLLGGAGRGFGGHGGGGFGGGYGGGGGFSGGGGGFGGGGASGRW